MDKNTARAELERRRGIAREGGGPEKIARHRQRGHITARERVENLVDKGTFVETGMLSLFQLPGTDKLLPASKLHGFGQINGRVVSIQSDDSTVLAGTGAGSGRRYQTSRAGYGTAGLTCPTIRFAESGGVHLQSVQGSIGVLAVTMGIRPLASPRLVPRILGIMGNCFGDPTWNAVTSDFVVQVKPSTCMAVSGPRVLGVALEEKTTPEDLGGWKVHAEVTGQADAFAEDDIECAKLMREFVSYMPQNCREETPRLTTGDPKDRKLDILTTLIPENSTQIYDMDQVIKAIVDDGKYFMLKPYFGKSLTVCFARLDGYTVGIIANQPLHNNGIIGPDECDKATDMIVMCDSFNIPLLFLVDTPGYAGGKSIEEKRFVTKNMHWLQSLQMTTVPKLQLIVRKAYGLAMHNMCGPAAFSDFNAALTTADIRPMSPEVALNTVYKQRIQSASNPQAEKVVVIKELEQQSGPFHAAMNSVIDEIIEAADTRSFLINCLENVRGQRGSFIGQKNLQLWPTGF